MLSSGTGNLKPAGSAEMFRQTEALASFSRQVKILFLFLSLSRSLSLGLSLSVSLSLSLKHTLTHTLSLSVGPENRQIVIKLDLSSCAFLPLQDDDGEEEAERKEGLDREDEGQHRRGGDKTWSWSRSYKNILA